MVVTGWKANRLPSHPPNRFNRAQGISRPCWTATRSAEQGRALSNECRRIESATDHPPWWGELRPVVDTRRKKDHLLIELQESAQRQLRSVPDRSGWKQSRAADV